MIPSNRLLDKRFNGYRRMPIPNELDQIVKSVVDAYKQATPQARSTMIGQIRPGPAGLLSIYGERMAAIAVRTNSAAPLHDGLTAMALAETRLEDYRDNIMVLATINHAAETIGILPTSLVADLRDLFPASILDHFRHFFAQGPRRKSLEAMRLKTYGNGDDFRYG